jgi:small subunit ribosomal protein S4
MASARQFVNHGHFSVNGKPVNVPSYLVKPNDTVSVREKSRKMDAFQEAVRAAVPPPYISLSKADFSIKFLYLPPREEVPVICEIPLVIEFYSR